MISVWKERERRFSPWRSDVSPLPILSSLLQMTFAGLCAVLENGFKSELSDHTASKQLCHVTLLKPYKSQLSEHNIDVKT